jgi:SAM-dependent methyltransferase
MAKNVTKAFNGSPSGLSILDVGSRNVNGTYRPLFANCKYTGVDIAAGPCVDVVMTEEFKIPFGDNEFDVVVSGQCLEHCRNPFKLVEEMGRVVKVGGWVFLVAPSVMIIHRYPLDCFRFLPDGMKAMMEFAGLKTEKAYTVPFDVTRRGRTRSVEDCWGVGKKP